MCVPLPALAWSVRDHGVQQRSQCEIWETNSVCKLTASGEEGGEERGGRRGVLSFFGGTPANLAAGMLSPCIVFFSPAEVTAGDPPLASDDALLCVISSERPLCKVPGSFSCVRENSRLHATSARGVLSVRRTGSDGPLTHVHSYRSISFR